MSQARPEHQGEPDQRPGTELEGDLEYDLAHEVTAVQAAGEGQEPPHSDLMCVATETSEYDGDLGYDLAHDVPRP